MSSSLSFKEWFPLRRTFQHQSRSEQSGIVGRRIPLTAHRSLLTFFFLLLTAHCSLPTVLAASWTKQRTSSLAWLHAVYFLDSDRGWAVGSRGTLLSTNDSGKSWQAKPQPTEDAIRDIYFVDELIGWLLCERNIYDLKAND